MVNMSGMIVFSSMGLIMMMIMMTGKVIQIQIQKNDLFLKKNGAERKYSTIASNVKQENDNNEKPVIMNNISVIMERKKNKPESLYI